MNCLINIINQKIEDSLLVLCTKKLLVNLKLILIFIILLLTSCIDRVSGPVWYTKYKLPGSILIAQGPYLPYFHSEDQISTHTPGTIFDIKLLASNYYFILNNDHRMFPDSHKLGDNTLHFYILKNKIPYYLDREIDKFNLVSDLNKKEICFLYSYKPSELYNMVKEDRDSIYKLVYILDKDKITYTAAYEDIKITNKPEYTFEEICGKK